MATAEIKLSATVLGLLTGNRTASPATASFDDAHGGVTLLDLSSGANTITIPTGATAALIVMPSTNTTGVTLKGVTGDTGLALAPAGWQLINWGASVPSTFVLTAAGAISNVEIAWF